MNKVIIAVILFFAASIAVQAQELNATIALNTQQVQVANTEIFRSLEESLKRLLNDQKWTNATFSRNERIDCSISISITEMTESSTFNAEIVINSRRPVYNSTYQSPIFNHKDTSFKFSYIYGQYLDYNILSVTDNLVAVIAFYAHIIIGLDFDSFQLNGGKPYFDKALEIANSAQTFGTSGWEAFSNKNNRYDLATALTSGSLSDFHVLWYQYHRKGLDEMATNPDRGRINIVESLILLKSLYEKQPRSALLSLFGETKLDELIQICSGCNQQDKKEIKRTLIKLFPTKSATINDL